MRTPILIFLMLFTMLLAQEGMAVRFAIPVGLEGQLVFENSGPQTQEVYQKIPITFNEHFDGVWEIAFPVKSGGALYRDIKEMVQPLQFDSNFDELKVYHRGSDGVLKRLPAGLANVLELGSPKIFGLGVVQITNFSSQALEGSIRSIGFTGRSKELATFQAGAYSVIEVPIKFSPGSSLEIQGNYPLGALLKSAPNFLGDGDHRVEKTIDKTSDGATEIFLPKARKFQKSDNPGSLFLLANESRTHSYTVRLTDPAQIQAARDQIKYPTGLRARILVGQVSAGSNRDNQNMVGPYKHMWSWHISKVFRFAELASQSCDGNPQFIEDVLPAWVGGGFNGGSTVICFWGYRVVEEL